MDVSVAQPLQVDSGLDQRTTGALEAKGEDLGDDDFQMGRAVDFRTIQPSLGFTTAYRVSSQSLPPRMRQVQAAF